MVDPYEQALANEDNRGRAAEVVTPEQYSDYFGSGTPDAIPASTNRQRGAGTDEPVQKGYW